MDEQPAQKPDSAETPPQSVKPENTQTEQMNPEEWFAPDEVTEPAPSKFSKFSKARTLIVAAVLGICVLGGGAYALINRQTSISTDESTLVEPNSFDSITDDSEENTNADDISEQGADASAPTIASNEPVPSAGSTPGTGPVAGTTNNTYDMNYTFNGCYLPPDRTIRLGDTIRFVNKDEKKKDMWPASDSHPSHLLYPEFDPGKAIAPGSSWSFTFTKKGSWAYHDHLKSSCGGTITVL